MLVLLLWVLVAIASDETPAEEGAAEAPERSCPVPDVVRVGAYLNDLQELDLKAHAYEFDGFMWFKWCNPELDPVATIQFLNPSALWGLTITPDYAVPDRLPDGSLYQVARVQGRFSTKMPLYNYPFDRQQIGPMWEDSIHNVGRLVYALDDPGEVTVNPRLQLPGYLIGTPRLEFSEEAYPTPFGDPRIDERPVYSRVRLLVPLSRPILQQMTVLMLPLISVIFTAALMFVLGRYWVDSRLGVGTTALLTIVALQITYNQEFSDIGYLMLMDKIYLASYLYVIVGLGVVVWNTPASYEAAAADPTTARWDLRGLVLTTTAYIVVCSVLIGMAAVGG